MPRGFDVASGSDLPDRLCKILEDFVERLKKFSIQTPITGSMIVESYRVRGIRISGADVRAIVNHLRQEDRGIGSCSDGYFFATRGDDLDGTIEHLLDRESGIRRARTGLQNAKRRMEGQDKLPFEEETSSSIATDEHGKVSCDEQETAIQ